MFGSDAASRNRRRGDLVAQKVIDAAAVVCELGARGDVPTRVRASHRGVIAPEYVHQRFACRPRRPSAPGDLRTQPPPGRVPFQQIFIQQFLLDGDCAVYDTVRNVPVPAEHHLASRIQQCPVPDLHRAEKVELEPTSFLVVGRQRWDVDVEQDVGSKVDEDASTLGVELEHTRAVEHIAHSTVMAHRIAAGEPFGGSQRARDPFLRRDDSFLDPHVDSHTSVPSLGSAPARLPGDGTTRGVSAHRVIAVPSTRTRDFRREVAAARQLALL